MVVLPDKAQGQKRNVTQPVQQVTIDASRLDKQVSELMANHLSPTKVKVNDLAIARLEEYHKQVSMESLLYPADELYNSNWDTIHVNPFRKSTIEFPDMYTINCQTFSMPIDNEVKITSKYGVRRRQMHRGTDLKVSIGDTIRAVFDGKVRIKSFERRGYGYYLVLRHPNGLETVYGHLSKFLVNENQIVRSGDAIGLGGNTGRSTGSHLHFETRFLGKDINPEEIIDFYNGAPYKDEYVFHNIKVNGKKTNMYSTSANAIAVHRVKRGETLSHIATMYGTTIAELCSLNGISRNVTLSIGQAIQFRAKQVTVEASPTVVSQTAKEEPTQTIASTPSANNFPEVTVSDEPVYHRIQSGDTLSSLAIKYGTTVKKICELNGISENRILRVGQQLRCS
jgi:murein DD-endopeptidase MepM/ murein hydrolase activator NlpD